MSIHDKACSRQTSSFFGLLQNLGTALDLSFVRRHKGRNPFDIKGRSRGLFGMLVASTLSEFRDEAGTTHQQNTAYDATRVKWVRLHPEPAEMVDEQRGD